ncbi:FAD-dependent oxidoreductase [Microbacterium paludicola]|uniref:FAD-dependent oxidoreductase n=1 Tax=Microbacterium paludicola TaxID=300019 RepID=UPI00387A7AD4
MDDTTVRPYRLTADCVIAGGGPAGLMLGLLLARAGVDTIVLEKHADFLRDFRGDTIHPSTQDSLAELGLLDEFLRLPHADMSQVGLRCRGQDVVLADFSRLPTRRHAIAFMPQHHFLDLLASASAREPRHRLLRRTRVTGLIHDGERVAGVQAEGPDGPVEVHARLVVGCDGRDSDVRRAAGLVPRRTRNAMDVLWFRLPRIGDERLPLFHAGDGALVVIDRGDFFQVAHIIRAGTWDPTPDALDRMRERVARLTPTLAERMAALTLDDVKLLTVRIERLRRWYRDGLLCIGDAAHAMSPAGGVGVNLAIQDAIATANLLAPLLRRGRPTPAALARVQRRRAFPAAVVQRVQSGLQRPMLFGSDKGLGSRGGLPLALRILRRVPLPRHVLGRLIGLGLRPEDVRQR